MSASFPWHIRRQPVALMAAAALLAALAASSVPAGTGVTASGSPPATPITADGVPVILRFADHAINATLTDTPATRQLAGMLPLTMHLKDVWGQAKAGRLPRPLTAKGAQPVHDPTPGEMYFWPPTQAFVVYYDDLDQTVPDPGLIRLGVADTGVDEIASTGRQVTVRIERATETPA